MIFDKKQVKIDTKKGDAMKYNEYGHWSEDGREYVITERKTPRHWYNYMFNDYYVAFASQVAFGDGFCQDKLTNRIKIITDRCLYVTDKESRTWHTACGLPMSAKYDRYECRHGLGYTTYVYEKDGIEGRYTIFVPEEGHREQWIVTLTNKRSAPADLGVIAYTATDADGPHEKQGYNSMEGYHDKETDALYHRVPSNFDTGENSVDYDYMMCDAPVYAYDCRNSGFIGMYGHKCAPEALVEGLGCRNTYSVVEKLCFALEVECKLDAGESKTFHYQIGHVRSKSEIAEKRADLAAGVPERLLSEVVERRKRESYGVTIKTPDERLNLAFNSFYKYATVMGSHWARVRHNGYRDMLNDTECLATFNPEMAWDKLKRILAWQYSTGYAPRNIKDGTINKLNFADCAVWMSATVHTLINELGDVKLLLEEVPFNDGTSASVFEHVRRAMQYLYDFHGENGLIKIWGGDWHDGLNWAGLEGKGTSVLLSILWYRANNLFAELADMLGESAIAGRHRAMSEAMRINIEEYGWDGSYYIEAINDDGKKIGSKESPYLKMWLVPNVWAVIAGVAPKEKLLGIMAEIDEKLECPYGTLNAVPAWRGETDTKWGNLTRQPAGTLLNSCVYMHPMTWKLMAEATLKRADALGRSLKKMLPWDHTYGETQGEPYILYNFYASDDAGYRAGIPGQSWRTATQHCLVRAMIRYIYGIVPTLDGIRLDPCLPPDWKECSITKDFRGCEYEISYHQEKCDGTLEIKVDGKHFDGGVLPYKKGAKLTVDVYC